MKLIIFSLFFLPFCIITAMQEVVTLPSQKTLQKRLLRIEKCNDFFTHSSFIQSIANKVMPVKDLFESIDYHTNIYRDNFKQLHFFHLYKNIFAVHMLKPKIIELCLKNNISVFEKLKKEECIPGKVLFKEKVLQRRLHCHQQKYPELNPNLIANIANHRLYPTQIFLIVLDELDQYIIEKGFGNPAQIAAIQSYGPTIVKIMLKTRPKAIKHLQDHGLIE